MRISVNGTPRDVDTGTTVERLIAGLALRPQHVAVEVNRELVPRATLAATELQDGDEVEIVTLVGGG